MNILIRFLISGIILLILDHFLTGLSFDSYVSALIFIFILGFVNIFIRPLVKLISFPVTILTLGLFSFVINAIMFYAASWFVSGVQVTGFFAALIGSLVLSFVQSLLTKKD